jgi:hypothetical protein
VSISPQAAPSQQESSESTSTQAQLFGGQAEPPPARVDYRAKAREVREEMHRREIGFPEWKVLDRVLLNSFDRGRRHAIIPKQKYICEAEALDKGTVSDAVTRFVQNEVLELRGEIWEVCPVSQWHLPARLERERATIAAGAVERLGEFNLVQPWLPLWPPSLHEETFFNGPTQVGVAPTAVGKAPTEPRGSVGTRPTQVGVAPTAEGPLINVGSKGTRSIARPTLDVQKKRVEELRADVLEFFKGSENRDLGADGKPFCAEDETVACDYVITRLAERGKAEDVRQAMAMIEDWEKTGHRTKTNRAARLLSELKNRTLELSWPVTFRGAS